MIPRNLRSAIASIPHLPTFARTGKQDDCVEASTEDQTSDRLSSDIILENLATYTSTLDNGGHWQPMARGNCEYFASNEITNFAQWVSLVVHVQDRVAILKAVSDCRSDKKSTRAEFRLLNIPKTQNAPQWAEITCTPILSEEFTITALCDISERKIRELEMLDKCNNADAANVEKSRFLANMSHELRTPLNAIIGFSELLKSGIVPASAVEKQAEYHGLINQSAEHLLNVLNDILDMSKIEAGKYEIYPEDVDINQIVLSCCSMLMPLASKAGVELRAKNPDQSIRLEADSKAVRQILINLISNAIKFTKPGKKIDISVNRYGQKIQLEIRDQGQGISAESLGRLGEAFHQVDNKTSRRHEGTGLGLSIVKGLISLHGGKFLIESQVGIGTTVKVILPQSLGMNHPVPARDADTIIRIKPNTAQSTPIKPTISKMAG